LAKINIDNINGQFASQQGLNNRFDLVEDALNNKVLYRDNPTGDPNQMNEDLDMNLKDIINANIVYARAFLTFESGGTVADAINIAYNDSTSNLGEDEVQGAIERLKVLLDINSVGIAGNASNIANNVSDINSNMATTVSALNSNLQGINNNSSDIADLAEIVNTAVEREGDNTAAGVTDYVAMAIPNILWGAFYSALAGTVGSKTIDLGFLDVLGFTVERVGDNRLSWSAGSANNDFGVL